MKIIPVVVWLNAKTKTGETEITVVTKDGKSKTGSRGTTTNGRCRFPYGMR